MTNDEPTSSLRQAVQALAERLRRSGKEPTAEYYDAVVGRIDAAEGRAQLRAIAQELASSARIVELANFDREDERTFDSMYARAKALLT